MSLHFTHVSPPHICLNINICFARKQKPKKCTMSIAVMHFPYLIWIEKNSGLYFFLLYPREWQTLPFSLFVCLFFFCVCESSMLLQLWFVCTLHFTPIAIWMFRSLPERCFKHNQLKVFFFSSILILCHYVYAHVIQFFVCLFFFFFWFRTIGFFLHILHILLCVALLFNLNWIFHFVYNIVIWLLINRIIK